jgi:acyl-coenzyme A thioesterase PaaI-like protein
MAKTAQWQQPDEHVLAQLGFLLMPHQMKAQMPLAAGLATPFGETRLGVLACFVDCAAGGIGLLAARPSWLVTTYLNLHVWTPPTGDALTATAAVLRSGRSTVILDVDLATEQSVGRASVGFAALPARREDPVMPDPPGNGLVQLGTGRVGMENLLPYLGTRTIDAASGSTVTTLNDHILNNLGILNGGVMCMLAEEAALLATASATGRPVSVTQLSLDFISAVRTGPVRTDAAVIGREAHGMIVQGRVIDGGADRVAATCTARVEIQSSGR